MAINIYTTPDIISTPYRPTYLDCSSDLGTITRMIADVYVNAVLVTTIDKDPIIGTTNQFRFEVGDVLKKYLTSDFVDISASIQGFNSLDSANNFYIRAFEVLDNGSTLDTSWTQGGSGTNYEQSSTRYTFNGVNQHEQTLSNYIAGSSSSNFLTNRPQYSEVPRSNFRIGVLCNLSPIRINLVLYSGKNGTGSIITNTNSSFTSTTNRRATFGIDLSDYSANAKSFRIILYDNFATQITNSFIYNIVDSCDDNTTIYWQNHWGEFDNFLFKGNKKQKTKTNSKSYEKRLTLDYSTSDRGEQDLTKENERTYTVYTNTQKPDVVEWLAEIGESVDVKIDGGIPINVKSVTSTIEDVDNLVYQIAVTYTMANKRINQLG